MRKTVIIGALALVILAGTFSVYKGYVTPFKKTAVDPIQERKDLDTAAALLKENKGVEALKIIQKYDHRISQTTKEGEEWLNLLVDASVQVGNPSQLVVLYEFFPSSIENNEKASLFVGKAYLDAKNGEAYEALRKKWAGKEQEKEIWLSLDADRLMLKGDQKEAVNLLKSQTFQGKEDANRLVKLAVLSLNTNAGDTWNYLSEAMEKDPENPYIRLYRARLLEASNNLPLALTEYVAAYQINKGNLVLLDQIGNFFVRYGQYDQALELWSTHLKPPTSDPFWIKSIFWSKVVNPIDLKTQGLTIPEGTLKPFVEYLTSLNSQQFWNESAFEKLSNSSQYLVAQQASFWLRLVALLQIGNEDKALELLRYNPFKAVSWAPDLERALAQVITYRKTGSLQVPYQLPNITSPKIPTSPNETGAPWNVSFFNDLDHYSESKTIPDDVKALLKSSDAFSAIFLAGGWRQAALELNQSKVISPSLPVWVAYGLTQAYRLNQGSEQALAFLNQQKPVEALQVLKGDILLSSKKIKDSMSILKPLASQSGAIGYRASWLLSLAYFEQKNYEEAKKTVLNQTQLKESISGQELIAEIDLAQGNEKEATEIYTKISNQSDEAKSYLARRAFEKKDWKIARELTQNLLVKYPMSPLLIDNMKQIEHQEKTSNR